MQTISLRLGDSLLRELDQKLAKRRYSTRTEFIRDAIRRKLSEFDKEEMLARVAELRGWSKRRTTDEQLHGARERAFDDLERKFGIK